MKQAKVKTTVIKAGEKLRKPHLRERNTDKDNEIFALKSRISELEKQVEEMKCCGNFGYGQPLTPLEAVDKNCLPCRSFRNWIQRPIANRPKEG